MKGNRRLASSGIAAGEEGKTWIVVLVLLVVVAGVVYGIVGVLGRRAEREAERLIELNHQELLRVSKSLGEAFQYVDALTPHWEVTRIRREATVLSNRFESARAENSRIRDDLREVTEGDSPLSVHDVISRAKLLQVSVADLAGEAAQQLVVLQLTNQLTNQAVQAIGMTEAELKSITTTMESSGPWDEIYRTRLDLLNSGLAQARTLFKRGIESLTAGEPKGRTVAQAAINRVEQLKLEIANLGKEITERAGAGGDEGQGG